MTIGKLSGQCDFGQKGQSYCNQRGQSCVAKRVKVAWLFHGKMIVGYLGGQPENYAEWKEVYSEKGGQYRMTVQYTQGAGRQLELTVNGEKQVLKQLGDDNGLRTVTVPVTLKPGYNTVRMGNSYNWAPDIDCFTLSK